MHPQFDIAKTPPAKSVRTNLEDKKQVADVPTKHRVNVQSITSAEMVIEIHRLEALPSTKENAEMLKAAQLAFFTQQHGLPVLHIGADEMCANYAATTAAHAKYKLDAIIRANPSLKAALRNI